MSNQKVSGGLPEGQQHQGAPPPYSAPQGSDPPTSATPVIYSQQPNYQTQGVLIAQPVAPTPGSGFLYRTSPALIICQHCNTTVTTRMSYKTGLLTWASAGVVCLFGGFLGCCLIPFFINATKDVVHNCPNCGQTVGMFRQMS